VYNRALKEGDAARLSAPEEAEALVDASMHALPRTRRRDAEAEHAADHPLHVHRCIFAMRVEL
jgi:hypothetical protein